MEAKSLEVREATVLDYRWQLSNHLLPFFHAHRLPDITVAEVDRYRECRGERESPLAHGAPPRQLAPAANCFSSAG